MTSVNVTFWLQLIEGVAGIVIPATLVIVASWAKAHFKLAAGSNAANILDLFVTAATQTVTSELAKASTTAAPIEIKNAAIAALVNDVSTSTQAAMDLKGVTAATLAARIDGAVQMALIPPAKVAG